MNSLKRKSTLRKTETDTFQSIHFAMPVAPPRRRQKKVNYLDHMKVMVRMAKENFIKTNQPLDDSDKAFIAEVLIKSFIFKDMDESDTAVISSSMFKCKVSQGQFVFKQNDIASY